MLKDIYTTFGGVGAFIVAISLCLIALTWLLALTGTVMRSMNLWKKSGLFILLALVPPASVAVLVAFLINDRRFSPVVTVKNSSLGSTPHTKRFP
jgi:hypothetical protein